MATKARTREVDSDSGETTQGRPVKPFHTFLQEHQHGELHDDLSEKLNELVTTVQGVGKGGTLTLKVDVKPAGRSHNQVFVSGKATLKLPEPDPEESIFFVDHDGNLTRKNPDQLELPALRRVDGAGTNATSAAPAESREEQEA